MTDREGPLPSNALRSHSTSMNSLFSFQNENSYSSILEYYDGAAESPPPSLTQEAGEEGSPLTLNYDGRHWNALREAPVLQGTEKFLVVLVGLPAVGKSTISGHLIRFLQNNPRLSHLRCGVFNAGQVRRDLTYSGRSMKLANSSGEDLFNPKNSDKKNMYARITLERLFRELDADRCDIAIFDATNSTISRRRFIFQQVHEYNTRLGSDINITPIVLQVTCNDENFIRFNIHNKTFNQDYFDKPYEYAVRDFAQRLKHYYTQYVPFTEDEFTTTIEAYMHIEGRTPGTYRGSLFFFSIINAGLDTDLSAPKVGFAPQISSAVAEVVAAFGDFVDHYAQMYGHKYITHANEFMKNGRNTIPSLGNEPISLTSRPSYLSTLCSIIDDQYFNSLHSLRK
ncbi:ADL183Cp [Eremothecium gossypii ATCC 10895]|uniref:ADL183Cp n=1 Tax=Eremothecium gossypii (strain ATCC 10895 / CBS 109.51 / FGSC 9923 / NRRL Y-1056) TaxID=284811 RepID=Q75AV3_EREGS|nr:ADL183Cp [Eremothecium gossypii ATCC 10895]AAS51737.1 ADL183Cp [Eremothecium gossypii ATCC 10895]AEY96034.1 FADL183Cp [Eremothecium gossypii FDAG1]